MINKEKFENRITSFIAIVLINFIAYSIFCFIYWDINPIKYVTTRIFMVIVSGIFSVFLIKKFHLK